jgi:hypothetical protein
MHPASTTAVGMKKQALAEGGAGEQFLRQVSDQPLG